MPAVGAPETARLVSAIRLYCDEDSQNRAFLKALRSRGVEAICTRSNRRLAPHSESLAIMYVRADD